MIAQTKVVQFGSYTRPEDGILVYQVHYGGVPVFAETPSRQFALGMAREQLAYYRGRYATVVYQRWDGDRREIRRELLYTRGGR